jgi:hypothetical protein
LQVAVADYGAEEERHAQGESAAISETVRQFVQKELTTTAAEHDRDAGTKAVFRRPRDARVRGKRWRSGGHSVRSRAKCDGSTLLPRQNVGHRMRVLVAERSLCKHGGFFLISLSFTLRFPYTFYVLATLILFLGVSAITVMPMDIFPEINIPVVSVIWRYTA